MLKLGKKKKGNLLPVNAENLTTWGGKKLYDTPYWSFLKVVSEMLDSAAKGQDIYMLVGTTQAKDQVSIVIKLNGEGEGVYADTLELAAGNTAGWLQGPSEGP